MEGLHDPSVAGSNFECSICLELSQDPVVTMCGHLFCWSCLHQWITIHSTFQECPVCKACVKGRIIPLYGRGKGGVLAEAKSETAVHELDTMQPAPAQRSCVAAAAAAISPRSMPSSTRLWHQGFSPRESRGGQSTYSASSFGLFPALFGFHMLTLSEYSTSTSTTSDASLRLPAVSHVTSQQQQHMNAPQEFVLYRFLILLACFTISCLLFF